MRKHLGAVVVSALALTTAACGSSSSGSTQKAPSSGATSSGTAKLRPLKLAAFGSPSILYSGLADGKFKNPPTISTIDSGPVALPLLQGGKLDGIVDVGDPPIVLAMAKKIPFKVVWVTILSHELLVGGKNVHSVGDLKGKKVASAVGSTTDFFLDGYLAKNNLKPSDIHKVDLPPSSMPAALASGQVDAAYTWPPYNTAMAAAPGSTVLDRQDDTAYVMVSAAAAQKHGAEVQQLVCDLAASSQDFRTNPDKAQAAVAAATKVPLATIKTLMPVSAIAPPNQVDAKWLGTSSQPSAQATLIEQYGPWLAAQQRIDKAPALETVQGVFDSSYALNAQSGKCG